MIRDESSAAAVPQDIKHVYLNHDLEVQYWTKRFEVSRQQLEVAVEKVGHSVGAVAGYLDRVR